MATAGSQSAELDNDDSEFLREIIEERAANASSDAKDEKHERGGSLIDNSSKDGGRDNIIKAGITAISTPGALPTKGDDDERKKEEDNDRNNATMPGAIHVPAMRRNPQQLDELDAKCRENTTELQPNNGLHQELQDLDAKCRVSTRTEMVAGTESTSPAGEGRHGRFRDDINSQKRDGGTNNNNNNNNTTTIDSSSSGVPLPATQLRRMQVNAFRQSQPGAIPMRGSCHGGNPITAPSEELGPESEGEEQKEEEEENPTLPEPDLTDDDAEAGLARATALGPSKYFLVHASEVGLPSDQDRGQGGRGGKKRNSVTWTLLAIIFLMVLVLGLSLGLGLNREDKEDNGPIVPSATPPAAPTTLFVSTEFPSAAPTGTLDLLLQDLPEYTLESLQKYGTPQWLALEWLSNHPDLTSIELWRKKQLFALACFFYSFDPENWKQAVRDRWLLYDLNECLWFSTQFGTFNHEGIFGVYDSGNWEYHLFGGLVPCNEIGEYVNLNLRFFGSLGSAAGIPPEIALLTGLTSIALDFNNLNFSLSDWLPSQLYQLKNLSLIHLSDNQLFGTIPNQFAQLTNLRKLHLAANLLSGTVPSWLSSLPMLESIAFRGNALTGPIPGSALASLTQISELRLEQNLLSNTVPTELGVLSQLVHFAAYQNELSGTIPSEFGLLTQLTYIRLSQNQLKYSIPSHLSSMNSLSELELWKNQLTGTIPTELGLMRNLSKLAIDKNDFTGSIPTQLGLLTKMTYFGLFLNHLTGQVPSELGLMTYLNDLHVWNNSLTGSLPSEVCLLQHWRECSFHYNRMNGTLPTQFGMATSLRRVRLHFNQFSGPIPSEFGMLPVVHNLVAQANLLSGIIPTEIGIIPELDIIDFSHNSLTGPIPTEIGLLKMDDGSLPTQMVHLSKLKSLALGGNDLTGQIPSQLGLIPFLEVLLLEDTLLSGSIPAELGNLGDLGVLDLSNMPFLSGSIPEEVSNLTFKLFRVHGSNQLSGTIADHLCTLDDPPCEVNYDSMRYQAHRWESRECVLDFDCSDQLCGCHCPCSNGSFGLA